MLRGFPIVIRSVSRDPTVVRVEFQEPNRSVHCFCLDLPTKIALYCTAYGDYSSISNTKPLRLPYPAYQITLVEFAAARNANRITYISQEDIVPLVDEEWLRHKYQQA